MQVNREYLHIKIFKYRRGCEFLSLPLSCNNRTRSIHLFPEQFALSEEGQTGLLCLAFVNPLVTITLAYILLSLPQHYTEGATKQACWSLIKCEAIEKVYGYMCQKNTLLSVFKKYIYASIYVFFFQFHLRCRYQKFDSLMGHLSF